LGPHILLQDFIYSNIAVSSKFPAQEGRTKVRKKDEERKGKEGKGKERKDGQ
jgi:hypothetical protein